MDHKLAVDAAEQAAGDSGLVAARHIEKPAMTFEVEMAAFQKGVIRKVCVPVDELTGVPEHDLERIFYWGQNDFQPVAGRCSVSMNDIVRFQGQRWLCAMMGFKHLGGEVVLT